ncbi:MAG: hypothetical protein ACYTKD_13935 [Planctomycetota bacterium]
MRTRRTYWLTADELAGLRSRRRLTPIRGVPCKGLNDEADASFVAPGVWDQTCRRQGGWYRESPKAGMFLVVSDGPVEELEGGPETVIEPCDFEAPRLATAEEAREMATSGAFSSRAPEGWSDIAERDRGHWRRLPSHLGSSGDVGELLELHSANHANLIEPRFTVTDAGCRAPYSVGRTADVCSACVELFNILGGEFETKYVVPCPGLVGFAGAETDRYLLVRTPKPSSRSDGP